MKKILLLCLFPLLFLEACSIGYVMKQGAHQFKLLALAEPIEKALRSPKLDPEFRKKLMLIQEVRRFCDQNLKLVVNKNYKDVSLGWGDKVYNVSASMPLEFKPYLWWFPIIGHVPYKGFFVPADARQELEGLKQKGFDTLMSGVGGYSTLGYFSDPVWPSMLRTEDADLVELIIHELAHSTIYFANQTIFNESFASFVGKKGAELFFEMKYGENSEPVKMMAKHITDEALQTKFFTDLHDELDKNYKSPSDASTKLALKKSILEQAKEKYQQLALPNTFKHIDWSRVNNAYLLSFKRYNYDEKIFADIFSLVQGDFGKFVSFIRYHGAGSEPFLDLRRAVERAVAKS